MKDIIRRPARSDRVHLDLSLVAKMLAEGQIEHLASLGVKFNSQTLGSSQQRSFATSARR